MRQRRQAESTGQVVGPSPRIPDMPGEAGSPDGGAARHVRQGHLDGLNNDPGQLVGTVELHLADEKYQPPEVSDGARQLSEQSMILAAPQHICIQNLHRRLLQQALAQVQS
jgi:hypothetical protein